MFQTNIIFFSSKSQWFFEGIIEHKKKMLRSILQPAVFLVEGFTFNMQGSHFKGFEKITEML